MRICFLTPVEISDRPARFRWLDRLTDSEVMRLERELFCISNLNLNITAVLTDRLIN